MPIKPPSAAGTRAKTKGLLSSVCGTLLCHPLLDSTILLFAGALALPAFKPASSPPHFMRGVHTSPELQPLLIELSKLAIGGRQLIKDRVAATEGNLVPAPDTPKACGRHFPLVTRLFVQQPFSVLNQLTHDLFEGLGHSTRTDRGLLPVDLFKGAACLDPLATAFTDNSLSMMLPLVVALTGGLLHQLTEECNSAQFGLGLRHSDFMFNLLQLPMHVVVTVCQDGTDSASLSPLSLSLSLSPLSLSLSLSLCSLSLVFPSLFSTFSRRRIRAQSHI